MAATQWPFLAAVLLLLSSGLHCSSSLPTCPQSCDCQRATLLNCSSSGLSSVPQLIQDSVTELDLSHNLLDSVTLHRPHRNLRNVRLGNNTIAHLSLCVERNPDGKYLRGRRRLRPWSRGGCVPWAPTLQLLSVERNLLERLPEGLEGARSLQVLQLSFNRISTLRPEDLSHLNQLKELDLKHNLITSLHPQMFQDLAQLKVLDLSFNMLSSLNPLMYFSLRNIGVNVGLGGNRWKCDCNMRSLRRQMAYDSSRGLQTWKMVCALPSALSGRDLLQLEEDDLNCFSAEIRPELHQDVTVYSSSEILLSCSAEDSVWWTPNGQVSVSHPQAGLLISDITERDTGLYVCVSEENQVVSVFNLQISQIGGAKRKPRSVPSISRQIIPQGSLNRVGEVRNQTTTQSDLALAVCLSILFTFLVAFILGVLARPCIDVLWKRVTTKKRSTETHVVSSVEQRQYDNEAYSIGEEQDGVEPFRERRVTFSNVDRTEENNVQYYDTVASGDQESINNDEVFDGEAAEAKRAKRTAGDSGSDSSSLQSNQENKQNDGRDLSHKARAGQTHKMEFERIPDSSELEDRRRMSSSSDSSQSENEVAHTTPKSPKVAVDSLQQKSDLPTTGKVEVPQISVEARSEIHGFSSEPISDWSPHKKSTDHAVLQENEEQFEFSDSTGSSSAFDSFNDPKLTVAPTLDKKNGDDTSSSSSHVSEDEHYTVNSNNNKGDYRHDTKRPAPRPGHSFSSGSSDSDDEPVQSTIKQAGKEKIIHENDKLSSRTVTGEKDVSEKIKPMPRTKWRGVSLAVASVSKGVAPSPPARHSSTSSSDNEADITHLKGKQNKGTLSQDKATLNNSAPLPSSGSSSSSDSEEVTTKHIRKQEQGDVYMSRPPIKVSRTVSREQETHRPVVDLEHTTSIKRHRDIKEPSISSNSSPSSDSEDEITSQTKKQGDVQVTQLPLKGSHTISREPETKRPSVDLKHTTPIKRQAPSAPFDSSSGSDSEDETKGQIDKQRPGKFITPQLPFQGSQTKSPEERWPTLDLLHIPRIKRRLDIKAPSQTSDSSSSSDSEEDRKKIIKKQEPGNVHMPMLPIKVSQTVSHEPGRHRPVIDHQHTTSIKRHPVTKAQSASSDSSSSSDSEDDTTGHTEKQWPGKLNSAGLLQKPQTKSPDPNAKWPTLDLMHIPRLKRRLDIKASAAASDSSSSSDSEEERIKSIKLQEQGNVHMPIPLIKESQTLRRDPGTHQTLLDFEHTPSIKKRPLIKAPSASSGSSSSSDSEDDTTGHVAKPGEFNTAEMLLQKPQTKSPDPNAKWPTLDLLHIPRLKRRLDIKASSAASDSSSSSDSEEETIKSIKKQEQGNVHMPVPPIKVPQRLNHDPGTHQTLLDLDHTTSIKMRPLIKAPSASSDSSSSSDSEDETTKSTKEQEQGKLHMSRPSVKVRHDPITQRPLHDLEHTTPIKRHPDIKAPSVSSGSSSSSDSEDETGLMKNQRPGKLITTGLSMHGSQTKSHDPDARWPGLDLRHIPRLKRRLDIKAPSPASDSSSSSDSEEETTKSIKNHGEIHVSKPSVKVSQTLSRDPETQRPLLDLDHTTSIKKQLEVKAPSASSDSSSSSDSDNEAGHMEKQRPGKLITTGLSMQASQTKRHDPDAKWPGLDLRHIPRLKRRLDIKAPSPASDSSSSSDSEEETTKSIKNHGEVHVAKPSVKVSQTVSHDPGTQRSLLDLDHTTSIKKQLEVKAPSASSDSSSSSDSDNEAGHMEKQRPGKLITTGLSMQASQTKRHDPDAKWPGLDLQHIPRLKRRLDIKAPSPASDSSSSSDSEEETTKSIKNHGEIHMSKPSVKVSQTLSRDPGTQRPLLDLDHTTSIKKQLEVKAPSASSDSSSSSDSDNEAGHMEKQRPGKLITTGLSMQASQTKRHDPDAKWPGLDLRHIPRLKRRLDIKAPSPASDSSSSSDSEEETTKSIKNHGEVHVSKPSVKVSQTVSHDPGTQRSLLDLDHTTSIKKQLEVKAPSASSDSSSSSDSDNEAGHMEKQRPGKLITTGLSMQASQTKRHDPDAKWPGLDLQHIPRLKRRLDIKAPSPASDSSSSSDSEEETTKSIKNHGEIHVSKPSVKVSQTLSRDPGTQRPLLDLDHTTSIKKQLEVKAPSASSDSSSSSDSDNEAGHMEKRRPGKLITTGLSMQGSQTKRHDPDAKWPGLDLQHIPHLKRRLDIKAPSPASDSSSSSDSEEETTKSIKNHGELHMSRPSIKISQTVSHDPGTQRPLLNLEHTTPIKRHPDIKAPSASSDSSSSSDSEDETTTHIKNQEQGEILLSRPPKKVSPTASHEPETRWPLLDLERTTSIKRRLDIKPLPAASDSSSSSDSEDEITKHIKKQEQQPLIKVSQTVSRDPGTQRPATDLDYTTSINKQLSVKAPSVSSDSSSSSDSEDETGHMKKQRPRKLITTGLSLQGSQTQRHDPDARWTSLDLRRIPRLKRRLDIKAPSPPSDSSSSSDSEEESIKNHGELHMSRPSIKISQTVSRDPGTQRPLLDLEHTTPINRRLDVKAPTVPSDSSSSSGSEDETTTRTMKKGDAHVTQLPNKVSQTVSHEPETRWPLLDFEHTTSIKRRLDIKTATTVSSGSSSRSDSENETGHTEKQRPGKLDIAGLPFRRSPSVDLGNITHKKPLDIKALPTQPDLGLKSASLGSQKSESNSSTSDTDNEKRSHKAKVGAGVSVTSKVPEKGLMSFPKVPLRTIFNSPKTEQNIKLIKYTVVSDDVGNKPTNDNIHKTPDISPELQSRWATMNLSLSRSRKRLESTSQKQKSSDLPSSPPPVSPSYSGESGPGSPISRTRFKRKDVGITLTGSSLIHDNKPVNASPTMKDQPDTMFGFGAPHNRKHLDIRAREKAPATASQQQQPDSFSSSDSEGERVDHKAPDPSFSVPHIQRHLNIKAPSPEPSSSSSSSSDSEKEVQKYSDKQSRYALNMTDNDSAVTYKRAIIKTTSLPGNSLSPSGNAPTSPSTAPSMSFDAVVKRKIQQSQHKTDLDLPPKLTWTGIGHHLSDLSISTPNLNTVSTQPASLAEPKRPPAYTSSAKSDIKMKQDSAKSDVTTVHKHSSLRADPVSPTSRGALHKFMSLPSNTHETSRAVTEDKRERRGLKALKNMALERQQFEAEDLNKGAFPLFDSSVQPSDTSFDYRRSEAGINVLSKQPLTRLSSASIIERRPTDLSYEISHYRSHNVEEPSQATPPAIPAPPPPSYEAAGLTWRSPQNTQKQVWVGDMSYQQQRKSSEGSDTSSEDSNSLKFDYSNAISHV